MLAQLRASTHPLGGCRPLAEIPQCSDLLTDPPQFDMLREVSGCR
jgi:hypothetical protein